MINTVQAVRGMNDILPDEAQHWDQFEDIVRDWLRSYGYRPIRLPIVEQTPLFARAIGSATDIVEKEMYSFIDHLNGESLTLRPEGTASCVRAVLQHNLLYGAPQRLFYMGPMFRHERPQKGRYRQFHQIGVEAMGFAGPDIDAEHILMCARLWGDLGLDELRLEINSLGNTAERASHRAQLIVYLEAHEGQLDADARRRLHSNPLRVLDSKNPQMQDLIEAAPKLIDHLGEQSMAHFEGVQQYLKDAGLPFRINTRLVRGLDYYNYTVFEWVTDKLGAQGTVCAGGRYDSLVEQLGGKPVAACGFAMGVERLIALMEGQRSQGAASGTEIYVLHQGAEAARVAFSVAEMLRDAGLAVVCHCGGGSFKSQMKRADGSGALLALIIGEEEMAADAISVKPLRENVGQQRVARAALLDHVSDYLLGLEDENDGDL